MLLPGHLLVKGLFRRMEVTLPTTVVEGVAPHMAALRAKAARATLAIRPSVRGERQVCNMAKRAQQAMIPSFWVPVVAVERGTALPLGETAATEEGPSCSRACIWGRAPAW